VKHFIGGSALGFTLSVFMPKEWPNWLGALLGGLIAWGLLP